MSQTMGRWTLVLALLALGLLVLAALTGTAAAASLSEMIGAGSASGVESSLSLADQGRALEGLLLGALGLFALALVQHAESWR